jgi:hypothetical protein
VISQVEDVAASWDSHAELVSTLLDALRRPLLRDLTEQRLLLPGQVRVVALQLADAEAARAKRGVDNEQADQPAAEQGQHEQNEPNPWQGHGGRGAAHAGGSWLGCAGSGRASPEQFRRCSRRLRGTLADDAQMAPAGRYGTGASCGAAAGSCSTGTASTGAASTGAASPVTASPVTACRVAAGPGHPATGVLTTGCLTTGCLTTGCLTTGALATGAGSSATWPAGTRTVRACTVAAGFGQPATITGAATAHPVSTGTVQAPADTARVGQPTAIPGAAAASPVKSSTVSAVAGRPAAGVLTAGVLTTRVLTTGAGAAASGYPGTALIRRTASCRRAQPARYL